jgi:hypothetical protein
MPLIKVKLLQDASLATLATELAAYKAGAGAALLTSQRASAMSSFKEADSDPGVMLALAHGGQLAPVSKFGDLEHVVARESGSLAECQAAIDAALAASVFKTVADAVTTAPGVLTSATMAFEAEDVGRKLRIGALEKTITVRNSATSVNYDNAAGDFVSGTGQTVSMLGAEVLQDLELSASKGKAGEFEVTVLMVLGGQLQA